MFRLDMLPANEGDCLWLSYGNTNSVKHILIDGGRARTYDAVKARCEALPSTQCRLELLVITHIDRDHIEGVLKLIEDPNPTVDFRDIWFNGYDHLQNEALETFGARQGEQLTTALLTQRLPWNERFARAAVEAPADGPAAPLQLAGGLSITLLSPDRSQLKKLIPRWEKECEAAGLIPGVAAEPEPLPPGVERMGRLDIDELAEAPFEPDTKAPNGSSIAFLAEHDGRRVLCSGDAHVERLITALKPLAQAQGGRLKLDAFKIPHHGSKGNISRELLALIDCKCYLISTSGAYFRHPDAEAIARLIKFGGDEIELIFNYRSRQTALWDNPRWQEKYRYRTVYPESSKDGHTSLLL